VFAFALVGLRLIIIWVVNNTRDSVLMAILMHASWNTFYATCLIRLFPTRAILGSYSNLTIGACALALVLIVATRGRLGCQNEADTLPEAAVLPG
jgi:membrane protease YdiL (CAAX protease family)